MAGPRSSRDPELIAAVATPAGRGGVGIVRVSGGEEAVRALARKITQRHLAPSGAGEIAPGAAISPRRAHLASFFDGGGELIDQGLVLYFPAPASFTGEHVIEFQGHGSPVGMRLLLGRCLELGARLARPGEFSERAFLNGRLDLTQAEAIADLIDAGTARAAKSAARSLNGEFSRAVHRLADELVELRALTEATLDFPDEEIDFLEAADAFRRLDAVAASLDAVFARARRGSLLRGGLHVVLIGQPNVGKSSLLNRLAGEDLAIVSPIAGTTRDALKSQIEIHGIPLHVIDTAGLRATADAVEQLGIERTRREIARADLAVLLVDARTGPTADDLAIVAELPAGLPRLTVVNKIDLAGGTAGRQERNGEVHIHLSAKDGPGLDALEAELLARAGWAGDEDVFIARERHLAALTAAREHLTAARAQIGRLELFAEELRRAHLALQAITGEYGVEELLGTIFGEFCIGK